MPLSGEEASSVAQPSGQPAAVADEAEAIVRMAHDAIGREETDPAITLAQLGLNGDPGRPLISGRVLAIGRAAAAILLVLGCAGAFTQGWQQGAKSESVAQPDRRSDQ